MKKSYRKTGIKKRYTRKMRVRRPLTDGSLVTKIDFLYQVSCPSDNSYSLIAIGGDGVYRTVPATAEANALTWE